MTQNYFWSTQKISYRNSIAVEKVQISKIALKTQNKKKKYSAKLP